jgi:predicted metal-dependent HD superfamily phosphohydrolase
VPIDNLLYLAWKEIWEPCGPFSLKIDKAWFLIQKAYNVKSRHYHNLLHIRQMIDSSINFSKLIQDIKTLRLAIFYHDIVYSAKSDKNEEKSAKLAQKELKELGYHWPLIEKCTSYIMASKTHTTHNGDSDLDYFIDFDLEKLGAPWPEYLEYSKQIRKEYSIYPDVIYKPGRKKALLHFVNRPQIYKTKSFIDKLEENARQNMLKEIEMLQ